MATNPVAGLDVAGDLGVFGDLPVGKPASTDLGVFSDLPKQSAFARGARLGGLRLGASAVRAAQAASTSLGLEIKEPLGVAAESLEARAAKFAPRIPSPYEVEDIESALDYASGLLGEQSVQLPITIASVLLGRRIGMRFSGSERALAAIAGGSAGAFVPSYIQNLGDIYSEQQEAGVDDPETAMRYALPVAALDALGPGLLAGIILSPGREAARRSLRNAVSRIVGGIFGGAAEEAVTETAQEEIALRARAAVDPTFQVDSDEAIRRRVSAAVGGALVGGVVGGGGGAVSAALAPGAAPVPSAPPAPPAPAETPLPTILPQERILTFPDITLGTEAGITERIAAAEAAVDAQLVQRAAATRAQREGAVLSETGASQQSPERALADLMAKQVTALESRITDLNTEFNLPANERTRSKQEIAQERKQITALLEQSRQRAAQLNAVAETAPYQPKTSLVQATLLNVQPDPEVQNATEKREIERSNQPEHQDGDRPREAARPGGRDSDAGRRQAETEEARIRREPEQVFQEAIARIKRERGMLLTAEQAKIARRAEAEQAAQPAPEIIVAAQREPRIRLRDAPVAERRGAFVTEADRVVQSNLNELVASDVLAERTSTSIRTSIVRTVEKAIEGASVAEARDQIEAGIESALKGKINKIDRQAVADKIINDLSQRQGAFIAPATDAPLRTTRPVARVSLTPEQAQANKQLAKRTLLTEVKAGRLTEQHAFRGLDRERLEQLARTGDWDAVIGTDAEGRPGHFASLLSKEGFAAYGEGFGVIIPPGKHTPSGRAGEVIGSDKLDPKTLKYVVGNKILSWKEMQQEISGSPAAAQQQALFEPTREELEAVRDGLVQQRESLRAAGTLTTEQDNAIESRLADVAAALNEEPVVVEKPFNLEKAKGMAQTIVEKTTVNGGGSFNLFTGEELGGTANYAVSPYKARELALPGIPVKEQVQEYIETNRDLLANPRNILGTWYNPNDGHTYLDVSTVTPSLTKAKAIAMRANQLAIFNLRTFETIPVEAQVPAQPQLFTRANQFVNLDRFHQSKGQDAIAYLERIIGGPPRLVVRPFVQGDPNGYAGTVKFGHMKDVIELAMNAKDVLSVAAHEGFHFIETRVLDRSEREILKREFSDGARLFNILNEKVRAYDQANGTDIANEIQAVQAERHAYGFEFWKRGELQADGALGRVFQKIRQFLLRVSNFVNGLGFRTAEDIFASIERGAYANRDLQTLRVEDVEGESWFNDIEPDAIPGLQRKGSKPAETTASSRARGRPYWVKTGADVARMRRRLKQLALEGETARPWHRESGEEMLKLYRGDKKQAEILAKLVAVFSPRTPVGTDLMFAFQAINQFRRNEPIQAGVFPSAMSKKALQILTGAEDQTLVTGIKRNTFYRNLMNSIDPVNFHTETQGATIDMWMAHAFGFNHNIQGKVNKSEYRYAEAETGRLARELGWTIEEVQAAIWTATKARYNQTRADARKWGIQNKLFVAKPDDSPQVNLFKTPGGRATQLKDDPKVHRKYLEYWTNLAMSVPLDPVFYEDARYNYAMAIREFLASGRVTPHNIEQGDLDMVDEVNTEQDTAQLTLQFYSKSALADLINEAKRGEAPMAQMYSAIGSMMDSAQIPEDMQRTVFGNTVKGYTRAVTGSFKSFYDEHISSGLHLARKSAGYKNVFGVLTAYNQRKNRLIADGVDTKLSEWRSGATEANFDNVSRALLDRTVSGYRIDAPEMAPILARLDEKERAMFKQATDMIADRLRAEFEADKRSFATLLGADSPQYAEWLANRSRQVEQLIAEGYFPERRYGDHAMHIYMDVDGKRLTLGYELFEQRGTAEQRVAAMQAVLRDFPEIKTEYAYKYRAEYDGSVSFQQFLDLARRNGVDLTQAERERLAKAMVASDSVRRNRIFRRKNVPGFSEDGMRILAEFAVTMSNKIAYSEFGSAIQDSLKGTVVDVKFDAAGNPEVNTYENTNAWANDGELTGFYRNLADRTTDFVMSPNPGNKVSSVLRGAATFQFLGGSLAAGAIQLSSLAMNSTPYLSGHTSYTNALAKVFSGLRTVTTNHAKLTNIATLQDKNVAIAGVDEIEGLRDALTRAAQDGTNLDTEIYQIMGLTRGRILSMSRNVQRAISVWMAPFRITEQWNRISTFIAAYKVGQENNLTGEQLYRFAQDAVYNTQFRYDEANRPALARGPVGALLFTFKTYPIFMLETMTMLAKENPKAAVIMLLSLTAMAGVEGLPFAEDIEDLIDTIAQRVFGSPFNTKRAMRNVFKSASEMIIGVDLSGVLLNGVANQITGLNFSNRVGLGNLLPGSRMGAADADYKRVVSEILGPAGAVATGWLSGIDRLSRGEFNQAAKVALPLAIQNVIKGTEQWYTGQATDIAGRTLVPVNGWESFFQAVGFSSNALTNAYEIDRIDKSTLAFYKEAQQSVFRDIIEGVRKGDSGRIQDAFEAVRAWNRAYPAMPIVVNGPAIRRQIALAGMPINQRTLLTMPRALRGTSESMDELYGTGR